MENPEETHDNLIQKIIFKHFSKNAEKIERMKTGIDNEVYFVQIENVDYVVRMNTRESIKGSSINIPLFKSKGIKVPEIIVEDYSKELIPYNWQILSKIEGVDIGGIISSLTEEQLQEIANEIAAIIKKLITIPTNGSFGTIRIGDNRIEASLNKVVEKMLLKIKERSIKTGVVKQKYIEVFEEILKEYELYFKNAPSQFYFDDMASKNVMIHDGKFNGLVDLDMVSYGDFLELVGIIKTSWYGTKYGDYYTNAVMDNLNLNSEQRRMVIVWALLNRIYWQSEIGIQFNKNTSANIDQNKVEAGNKVIDGLIAELNL